MPRITFLPDRDNNGKALTGYGGIPLGVTITRNFRDDLAHALETEHGNCSDDGCDIAAMIENGYVYQATHALFSATDEFRELDRVVDAHRFNGTVPADFGTHLYDNADWPDWLAHHEKYGVPCEACGSYNYGNDYWTPEQCGNCLAELPKTTTDDDED